MNSTPSTWKSTSGHGVSEWSVFRPPLAMPPYMFANSAEQWPESTPILTFKVSLRTDCILHDFKRQTTKKQTNLEFALNSRVQALPFWVPRTIFHRTLGRTDSPRQGQTPMNAPLDLCWKQESTAGLLANFKPLSYSIKIKKCTLGLERWLSG